MECESVHLQDRNEKELEENCWYNDGGNNACINGCL